MEPEKYTYIQDNGSVEAEERCLSSKLRGRRPGYRRDGIIMVGEWFVGGVLLEDL